VGFIAAPRMMMGKVAMPLPEIRPWLSSTHLVVTLLAELS